MSHIFELPDGVAEVIGFHRNDHGWVRFERHVRLGRPVALRSVSCCGPDDLSGHEHASSDDVSCDDSLWRSPHTVHLHDQETRRPLS